ncbi:MAG: hypothetical protein AUK47_02720 [Deltaproteobacteria bacterium CG2_30_63_29]|nr:MAG: hypothetical protein AUK47_02720 [Deltaproteobacteria bacterium CG2_30_63_29]PIW01998.1 MAG: hypothetical protein COW42_03165 [Deltaproteobacteria bacterium CG17_big_fil_post_rev_8_21_14_2_50_63_7]PJB37932.1 MAG: hypothetical protein CO108_20030 [Deltaproteobacteria bacterium CG_4_9_14_3_um_filter_63_12]
MFSSDNKRLFLAVGVSMAILLAWQLFFFEPPAPPEEESDAATVAEEVTKPEGGDPKTDGTKAAETAPLTTTPREIPHESAFLKTDYFLMELTNVGARVANFNVMQPARYIEHPSLTASLYDGLVDGELPELLPLESNFSALPVDGQTPFEVVTASDERVHYKWVSEDGLSSVEKTFFIGDTPYAVNLEVKVTNLGTTIHTDTHSLSLFNKQLEAEKPGFFSQGRIVDAVCFTDGDVERVDTGDDAEVYENSVEWIAVNESYFASVAYASDGANGCRIAGDGDDVEAVLENEVTIPKGESRTLSFELYFGPKEIGSLSEFGHEIDRAVDYGWVEILARPIAWLLRKLFSVFGNWGLAIIFLTILIRGAVWPITQKSQESMMRMRDISPLIKELQEKYKNDPTLLQQKQMELFRENNVSPFGCLPLLLQIPIWFALYRTIYVTAELYRADFGLWIHDLSAADPYYILPVIAGALFFLQQKLSPTPTTDVRQKVMMTVFPLVFIVVMLFLPSGLNLYILVSSTIGVLQVVYTKKKKAKATPTSSPADITVDPTTAKEKRAAKRRQSPS